MRTGQYTGRLPKDKFLVREPSSEDKICWGRVNRPFEMDRFKARSRVAFAPTCKARIFSYKRNLPFASEAGIVFSRIYRDGVVDVPSDDSVIHTGDILRPVGPKAKLAEFEKVIGRRSALDLRSVPCQVTTEHLYVTKGSVIAFAGTITKSDQPLAAYAAVYPLVMILRVFVVQILVLTLQA